MNQSGNLNFYFKVSTFSNRRSYRFSNIPCIFQNIRQFLLFEIFRERARTTSTRFGQAEYCGDPMWGSPKCWQEERFTWCKNSSHRVSQPKLTRARFAPFCILTFLLPPPPNILSSFILYLKTNILFVALNYLKTNLFPFHFLYMKMIYSTLLCAISRFECVSEKKVRPSFPPLEVPCFFFFFCVGENVLSGVILVKSWVGES